MFVEQRWNENLRIDWSHVKTVWEQHWDLDRPVLLEKSPPNLIRAKQLADHFDPAYFFVVWRNPYAHCESQIRRNGNPPMRAAAFAINCLRHQQANIESLDRVLPISYEQLTEKPKDFAEKALRFLPELNRITTTGTFHVHNLRNEALEVTNLNNEKISRLSVSELQKINDVFVRNQSIMDYFGYNLIK